jgi:hypothetical protein
LLSALRHCVRKSKICKLAKNPLENVTRPKKSEPKRIVLDDGCTDGPEWKKLYAAMNPGVQPVLLGLYESAMRPSEIFAMR